MFSPMSLTNVMLSLEIIILIYFNVSKKLFPIKWAVFLKCCWPISNCPSLLPRLQSFFLNQLKSIDLVPNASPHKSISDYCSFLSCVVFLCLSTLALDLVLPMLQWILEMFREVMVRM